MDRKTIGRYEILDELGRGAMGCVLRARDPAMDRVIALKCILSASLAGDQMKEFRERFYREARAAGALSHPGIVPVFDVGEDDGVPFLVMELVQGRTLDAALKQGERYSIERVCEIGMQLADALGYAHRNGVIHRDIKPANILMTSREVYGTERPRITDFGVAKLAGGDVTTTGQLLGTPAFMPPEQFTGAPIDGRTDIFALGVILYRMTTGEQPFAGETLTAVSYKIVHTEPIPPAKLNPAVPAQVEAVILKCLAKSAADRYQTGEDLAAALAAALPGVRTTGSYRTQSQAAGETIDQVASLRPRPAAETMAAPSLAPGTQTRPAPQPTRPAAAPSAPPPAPVRTPPPAPTPAQTWARATQSAPPQPARPAAAPGPPP
ncbi:MAG: serine/threonine-protein kinase, partial [Acidobacteriota bacterium]